MKQLKRINQSDRQSSIIGKCSICTGWMVSISVTLETRFSCSTSKQATEKHCIKADTYATLANKVVCFPPETTVDPW